MQKRVSPPEHSIVNPYVALVDILINFSLLVLVLAFAQQLGGWGNEEAKGASEAEGVVYKPEQEEVYEALKRSVGARCPERVTDTNDPPGSLRLRWSPENIRLFVRTPRGISLTEEGREVLTYLRLELSKHQDKYRRIRVEGHVAPGKTDEESWRLWRDSCEMAVQAAQVLMGSRGKIIQSYKLMVAGRGGQAPLAKYEDGGITKRLLYDPADPKHDRIEIVLEFAEKAATGSPTREK